MPIVELAEFRAFDALGAFTELSDSLVEAELLHAEEMLFSFTDGRGYSSVTDANVAVHRAICKVARVELLGIRGVNPADAGHAMAILERDNAVKWFRDSIASGKANLTGTNAPTRTAAGIARAFSSAPTNDDGTQTRGW